MKLTKSQLKQIIKEELEKAVEQLDEISRRGFLKGLAGTAGAAALSTVLPKGAEAHGTIKPQLNRSLRGFKIPEIFHSISGDIAEFRNILRELWWKSPPEGIKYPGKCTDVAEQEVPCAAGDHFYEVINDDILTPWNNLATALDKELKSRGEM